MKYVLINSFILGRLQLQYPSLQAHIRNIKLDDELEDLLDNIYILDNKDKNYFRKINLFKVLN